MTGFASAELTPDQQEGLARRDAGSLSPYGNAMMYPQDIAEVALFLVSDAARALQGPFILADRAITSAAARGD